MIFTFLSFYPFLCFTQLFSQFDADGEGYADVETFLEVCIIFSNVVISETKFWWMY